MCWRVCGPILALAGAFALVTGPYSAASAQSGILIFAASSMQTAVDAMAADMGKAAGSPVRVSYAASSTLARQIENGAPADVFISADLEWMDYVESRGLLRANSRTTIAGNTLVLVAPAGSSLRVTLAPGSSLAPHLGSGRLALADPASVPAGKYAKAALSALGLWDSIAARLAPTEHVRAALVLVSRGEAPLGVVYRTDAMASPDVRIVATFPSSSHPPIVYPAAVLRTAQAAADRVLAYLRDPAAQAVLQQQGFLTATR